MAQLNLGSENGGGSDFEVGGSVHNFSSHP